MGYYVNIELRNVVVPAANRTACLAAVNSLHTVDRWHSWVRPPETGKFSNLVEAFTEWRYEVDVDNEGNIRLNYFNGEKWGDDETLYATIAPFVADSSIMVIGEDGDIWGYEFENGSMFETRCVMQRA